MKGKWKSEEWGVTYTIRQEQGVWSITEEADMVLLGDGQLTTDKDGRLLLTGADKVQYIIEKGSDRQMTLQQTTTEDGLLGTTAAVTFVKVDE